MTQTAQPSRTSARERRKSIAQFLTFALLIGYSISLWTDIVLRDVDLFWLTAALIVGMIAAAFVWARSLDEAKLNAHYIAWYWGGSVGLTVSGLVFLAMLPLMLTENGIANLFPADLQSIAANLAFAAGLMLGMMPACIGYLIWWGVMQARRG